MSGKSVLDEIRKESERIERKARYDAKKERVPKPRAVRKFERYSRMGDDAEQNFGTKDDKKGT